MPDLIKVDLTASVPNYFSLETERKRNAFETFFKRQIVFEMKTFTG